MHNPSNMAGAKICCSCFFWKYQHLFNKWLQLNLICQLYLTKCSLFIWLELVLTASFRATDVKNFCSAPESLQYQVILAGLSLKGTSTGWFNSQFQAPCRTQFSWQNSAIFTLPFSCFWSPLTPERNIWLLSTQTLHCVHQLVSSFVRVLFVCQACGARRTFEQSFSVVCSQKRQHENSEKVKTTVARLKTELPSQVRLLCWFVTLRNFHTTHTAVISLLLLKLFPGC